MSNSANGTQAKDSGCSITNWIPSTDKCTNNKTNTILFAGAAVAVALGALAALAYLGPLAATGASLGVTQSAGFYGMVGGLGAGVALALAGTAKAYMYDGETKKADSDKKD